MEQRKSYDKILKYSVDIEGLKKKLAIKIQKKTQSMKVKFDLQMESF